MNFTDQFCTAEQAKTLKQLGLTLIPFYVHIQNSILGYEGIRRWSEKAYPKDAGVITFYPAYSTAELGMMLPDYPRTDLASLHIDKEFENYTHNGKWKLCTHGDYNVLGLFETEAQARAAMLIYLLENELILPFQIEMTYK